jgi:hypothetical protein
MYKFMIATNPLKGGRIFILHTPSPSCLIEVLKIENDTNNQNIGKVYTYALNSKKKEFYRLVVSKSLDNTNKDLSNFDQVLDRAWKWYFTLLQKQIFIMVQPFQKPLKSYRLNPHDGNSCKED